MANEAIGVEYVNQHEVFRNAFIATKLLLMLSYFHFLEFLFIFPYLNFNTKGLRIMNNFLMNMSINISRLLADLGVVAGEVNTILSTWVGPIFIALGGVGSVYIIVLAVQYAKSENDSKRAEAKTRMVNCIIGVLALLVIATGCLTVDWVGFVQMFGYASN